MRPLQVVVIDDEPNTCEFLSEVFTAEGHACQTFPRAESALEYLSSHHADLALIDVYLGTSNGLDVARAARSLQPALYVVVMTAHISLETAARSVVEGAIDYVAKPLMSSQLRAIGARVDEYRSQTTSSSPIEAATPPQQSAIVGHSAKMLEVYNAIGRVAPSKVNVLILGASGTGKELVASALHKYSTRSAQPFIPVNCGSFTETILESELFGHEKGAFTGANSLHKGLLESAYGGTLFLDEVTETTLSFQVKLLRAIQEQQIRRVGSTRSISIDVRVFAASNQDIAARIREGSFREDLYYRLSAVQIVLPTLQERREDIPLLVEHFVREFNSKNDRRVVIESLAVKRMQDMEWPGNVRELENAVNRLAIFAPTGRITLADLESETMRLAPGQSATVAAASGSDRLVEIERRQIARVLKECHGNKAEAARRLGIERKTLYKKALRLGISLHAVDGT